VLERFFFVDPPQRYPPYTRDKQLFMTAMFYPPVNYAFNKFVDLIEVKNVALAVLALATARNVLRTGKL